MRLAAATALVAVTASSAGAQRLAYVWADPPKAELSGNEGPSSTAGGPQLRYVLLDRLEWAPQRGHDVYAWDFSLLWGGERDGLWLSSVGEGGLWGSPDYLELQALYNRKRGDLSLNAGLRWDVTPAPQRLYLAAGGQWERAFGDHELWIGAFGYVSHTGELSARLGGVYNHSLGGNFYAQPSFELNASGADVPELGLGRGFSYAEAGLRLRYEVANGFGPYVGFTWDRSLGRTARLARAAGEETESTSVVLGLRAYWEPTP